MEKTVVVAALYIRNSDTTKMDTEVQKAQEEALRSYARDHQYEVREHLIFKEAVSAIKVPYWERKELLHLWDEGERGSFDVVLVTEMFRLARKAQEQFAIMEHFRRYKIRVESISEKFEDTPEGALLMSIQGYLGDVEAQKIHIRTARGKYHRAKQALSGQGQSAYGYEWADSKHYSNAYYVLSTRVFKDTYGKEWTEVTVIEWVYDGCLHGMSLRQMALQLTTWGVPTREGKSVWGVTTLRKILTDRKYTGRAVTTIDGEEIEIDGLVPRIIEEEVFEKVQSQLSLNAEMSPRNNKHPKETVMRGHVFCAECQRRMHVKHYYNAHGNQVQQAVYKCARNDGIDDTLHKHTISVSCSYVDAEAWQMALVYIRSPYLIHEFVKEFKEQIPTLDHAQDIEEGIAKINKAITNLYKLAEVADDPSELRERLVALQLKKRDLEKLNMGVLNTQEKQETLRTELDRFEAWAASQRSHLDDPSYIVTLEDKSAAVQFLGIKAVVRPANGHEKRVKLELMPLDIGRLLRSWCRE